MRKNLFVEKIVFLAFLLGLFAFAALGQDTTDQSQNNDTEQIRNQLMEQELRYLKSENEKLKKELKGYRLQERVDEIQKDVSRIRGLPVKETLKTKFLSRKDVADYVVRELNRQYPDDAIKHYQEFLVRLGFLPQGTDIVDLFVSLYTEQAAGFYDDLTRWFYIVEDFDLNETVSGIILSHEICHALQDQNFGVDIEGLYQKNNDDIAYAYLSVLEGDATILMGEWMKENFKLASLFDLLATLGIDQSSYEGAPYFLQQIMVFPYLQGSLFMMELMSVYGIEGRDKAFIEPPVSTEQILHPEKYHTFADLPTTVSLPKFDNLPLPGWEKRIENTVGEMALKFLFEQYMPLSEAGGAAAGWDGDRYTLYHRDPGFFLIYWESVWDSEKDAREAADALEKVMFKCYPLLKEKKASKGTFAAHRTEYPRGKDYLHVFIRPYRRNVYFCMSNDTLITSSVLFPSLGE